MLRVITLALTVFSASAQAATLTSYTSKEGKEIIILNGEIAAGDAEQLQNLTKTANAAGRLVSGVRLNSPGGNLLEGVKLAEAIRFGKIASVVPNGASCASACFIAFAAGAEKFASYSANVGVHGASNKDGTDAGDATVAMAKIVKELGVPASIIGKMVVTPPDQIVWLSPDDLRALGTTMTGKPAQVSSAAPKPSAIPQQVPSTAQAAAPTKSNLSWKEFTDIAFARSASQNGGKPQTVRTCQPETKQCHTAVMLKGSDGNFIMIRATEDLNGKMVSRDVCSFNSFMDVRTCRNWDTGESRKAMKNDRGDSVDVARE